MADERLDIRVAMDTTGALRQYQDFLKRLQTSMAQSGSSSVGSFLGSNSGTSLAAQARSLGYMKDLGRETDKTAQSFTRLGNQGKFAVRVLEAFVLYRGFVFLQQSIMESTRALIAMDHQISLSMTQMPKFGAGMRGVLTKGVMDIAVRTGQTFESVAQALYQVSSAGYDAKEALQILNTVSKAAVAGGVDMSTAFDAALTQMNVFGISADNIGSVLDKQFAAVRTGIFTYGQFAGQVAVVSEAFEQAGQSIDTTNAAMVAVSQVFTGPQFNRGATSIRQLASALASTPENFEDIGVAVHDADGNIRNLIPILDDLKAKMDGMPTGERGKLIAEIIPDKREQQAVLALIQNLDKMKQAYVEQRLALGNLDKAYGVVNQDILTNQQRLQRAVQDGFQPAVKGVETLLKGVNAMDGALLPVISGFTFLATTLAAAGLAMAFLNKETLIYNSQGQVVGVQTRRAAIGASLTTATPAYGPAQAGSAGYMMRAQQSSAGRFVRTPVGAAASLGAAATGYGLGQQGFSWGGLASSAGSGAVLGGLSGLAVGGAAAPIGAAIGGAVGAISYGITVAFQKEAPEAGKTFAQAFAAEFKRTSGDTAAAFVAAVGNAEKTQGAMGASELLRESYRAGDTLGFSSEGDIATAGMLYQIGAPLTGHGMGLSFTEDFDSGAVFREAVLQASQYANAKTAELEPYQDSSYYESALPATRAAAVSKSLRDSGVSQEFANFAIVLSEAGLSAEKAELALNALSDEDYAEFLRLTVFDTTAALDNFNASIKPWIAGMVGDFGATADILRSLGAEGENVANAFSRVSRSLSIYDEVEKLRAIRVPHEDPLTGQMVKGGVNPFEGILDFDRIAEATNNEFLRGLRELAAERGTDLTEAYITRRVQSGEGSMAEFDPFGGRQFASSGLGDAIRFAADNLWDMADSFGYTTEELYGLADGIDAFNKQVFKIGIIQQVQSLGEMIGLDPHVMDPAIRSLVQNIQLGGTSFMDLWADPTRLADLLAEVEFGDIAVDQSQDFTQQIIIRVSGDTDLSTAGAIDLGRNVAIGLRNEWRNSR